MVDLCKIKLSWKDFPNASVDRYVYQHASLDKVALIPHSCFIDEKETTFLISCSESSHFEIIYCEGMMQYFCTLII
ncbi:hypothetical protein MTR_3g069240 [Medicago truncatula]|uniref:At2g35280-like TPR domain-containing protein n=1 Tax=Medicago truncatula TaxID=3880 RepID=G7JA03_MEDTR|nr:hypothetical protein MTR_3g069240 [Medicago truncatula]